MLWYVNHKPFKKKKYQAFFDIIWEIFFLLSSKIFYIGLNLL